MVTDILARLEDARAEVARLERAAAAATCAEVGHDWKFIGGKNAGCCRDCGCSVDVHVCAKCGDCDYGDTDAADEKRKRCAETMEDATW